MCWHPMWERKETDELEADGKFFGLSLRQKVLRGKQNAEAISAIWVPFEICGWKIFIKTI